MKRIAHGRALAALALVIAAALVVMLLMAQWRL